MKESVLLYGRITEREISRPPKLHRAEGANAVQWGECNAAGGTVPGVGFIELLGGGDGRVAPSQSRCAMKARAPLSEVRVQRASRLTMNIRNFSVYPPPAGFTEALRLHGKRAAGA